MTTIEAKDLPKIRLHGCGSIADLTGETNGMQVVFLYVFVLTISDQTYQLVQDSFHQQ